MNRATKLGCSVEAAAKILVRGPHAGRYARDGFDAGRVVERWGARAHHPAPEVAAGPYKFREIGPRDVGLAEPFREQLSGRAEGSMHAPSTSLYRVRPSVNLYLLGALRVTFCHGSL